MSYYNKIITLPSRTTWIWMSETLYTQQFCRSEEHLCCGYPVSPHSPSSALLGLNMGAVQSTVIFLELSCSCTWSAIMWKWTVTFKLCPVATNVPFVCLGSTPYAITPACTFNTRKDALYVVCLPNSDPVINITNQYLLDLAVFSPTSSSYPVLVETCCFSSFPLLADRMTENWCLLLPL